MDNLTARQLAAIWGHPVIRPLFAAPEHTPDGDGGWLGRVAGESEFPEDPRGTREPTLAGVIEELMLLGSATLTLDPDAHELQRYVAALELRTIDGHPLLRGTGGCMELAALRCLMEAMEELGRRNRRSELEFQWLLDDRG